METDQINDVVRAYGKAAGRLKAGGFDGVEIMIGSGHLPEQFLSPFSNQRTDAYGGSLENRVRFSKGSHGVGQGKRGRGLRGRPAGRR